MKIEIPPNSQYYYDINSSSKKVSVFKEDCDTPKGLYKFFPLNKDSVDSFINEKLYAGHPFQFNDPFDNFRLFMKKLGIDDKTYQYFFIINGIICLTHPENWNNSLMWGHYNKNEGFNILFDHKKFLFKREGPFPMNYQENILKKDFFKKNEIPNEYHLFYLMTLKSNIWKYENEYRLIVSKGVPMESPKILIKEKTENLASRLFPYSLESVMEINLGHNFIFNCDRIDYKNENMIIRTDDNLRISVLSNIFDKKIKSYLMFPDEKKDFKLNRFEVEINKINSNSFKLHILGN